MNLSSEHSQALTNEKINSTTLSLMLKKLLCAFGTYFDGQLHKFVLTDEQQLVLKQIPLVDKTYSLMIVARKFYHEEAKTYPIESKSELNKLLKLQLHDSPETKHHLWQQQENQSFVNLWHFNTELPKSYIRLPESLLFSLGNRTEQITELGTSPPLFVGRQNNCIHSAVASPLINSGQRFVMSTGIQHNYTIREIPIENLAENLAIGCQKLTLSILISFSNSAAAQNKMLLFKKILLPSAITVMLYISLSSGYLYSKYHYLAALQTEQNVEIDTALQQQQNFDSHTNHYANIKAFLTDKKNAASFWLVFAEFIDDAFFDNIKFQQGRFILRGTTDNATALLAKISQHPKVKDAKFDRSTRKHKGKDDFIISFEVSAALAFSQSSSNNNAENSILPAIKSAEEK